MGCFRSRSWSRRPRCSSRWLAHHTPCFFSLAAPLKWAAPRKIPRGCRGKACTAHTCVSTSPLEAARNNDAPFCVSACSGWGVPLVRREQVVEGRRRPALRVHAKGGRACSPHRSIPNPWWVSLFGSGSKVDRRMLLLHGADQTAPRVCLCLCFVCRVCLLQGATCLVWPSSCSSSTTTCSRALSSPSTSPCLLVS